MWRMGYNGFRALELSQELAAECLLIADTFPQTEQGRRLADQLTRAATGAALNLAEGSARRSYRDYRRFLDSSHASLREVQVALGIVWKAGYIDEPTYRRLEALRDEASRTIYGVLRSVNRKIEQGITSRPM